MGTVPATAETTRFGKYSLVAKLAMGGMAEIFLARFQGAAGFEKLVCIKRMLPHLAEDQQLVQMFLVEAKIAAQISHPNVCQVFDLGEVDGRYYIAMEYLEGVPFACFRRMDLYPQPPDPRLVAGLGAQACEGLHHAHNLKRTDGTQLEVVHRDVSANNLFATIDGIVKVLDFGIAKVQDASVRTSTGSVKGTYAYMAPEQLRGERVDRRTDVFAMGTVLWETFARKHLFKRDTDFLTFQAITTDPIANVCELRPDVPPALGEAIAKALSRDPDDRYPTARALGEALTKSVAALGGPFTPSEISDDIARAFEARLREQHALVKLAREGGSLDLDAEVGKGIGHGTEFLTTPLSMVSGRGPVATEVLQPGRPSEPREAPVMPTAPPLATHLPTDARSATMRVAPLPPAPATGSRRWITIAASFGIVGAAAVGLYLWRSSEPSPPPPVVGLSPNPIAPALAPAPTPTPTATPTPTPTSTASPPTVGAAVPPPIVGQPVPHPPPENPAVANHPPVKPVKPIAGPPGFVTIDSVPVYATIYIDGKKYGDTPLIHFELPPGKHAVHAVSPSGASHNLSITIESGKVAPATRIEW